MAESPQPNSARWWLDVLYSRLRARQDEIQTMEAYYAGEHRLAFATDKFKNTFGSLFSAFADNWCDLIVDASAERLAVQGFRFGDTADADDDAWELWQSNFLDADSGMAMLEAVKLGEAAAIITPPGPDEEKARITVEHPSQVIVAHAPGNRRKRVAALKCWRDDDGRVLATVYLPDSIHKFEQKSEILDLIATDATGVSRSEWVPRAGVRHVSPNKLGIVPVVPLQNNPSMLGGGRSDLSKVIPLQDAINKLVTDMLVASEFVAIPQRYASGIEIPTDPVTGDPDTTRSAFQVGAGVVWAVEDENAKFGEFSAGDLNNYVGAIGMLIQHLSAQTRTPPHYLIGQIVNASGDALKAAETGLVSKVKRKQIDFAQSWEEVMRLAFLAQGDEARGKETKVETLWRDPESRSVGETVDAATKLATLGVPKEALWEMIGASPQQIERWRESPEAKLLAEQALTGAEPTEPAREEPAVTTDEETSRDG